MLLGCNSTAGIVDAGQKKKMGASLKRTRKKGNSRDVVHMSC